MKKVIFITATTLLVLVVLGGLGAYFVLRSQERGMTADGHMAPPASVRNAEVAPTFEAVKSKSSATTTQQPAEYQLPTEFKLPTELDIATPQVPRA